MFNAKRTIALTALALSSLGHAQGNPSKAPDGPARAAAAPADGPSGGTAPTARGATIGTITDLARELKIEQLKRDVREARREATSPSGTASMAGTRQALSQLNLALPGMTAPGTGGPNAQPLPPVAKAPPQPDVPTVLGIVGVGGRFKARLSDGREVAAGQNAGPWTVRTITPVNVSFEHCSIEQVVRKPKENQPQPEPTRTCMTRLVAPTA